MEAQVIKNKAQHEKYLTEIERLMETDPESGTPEGDRLELFGTLVEVYEKEHYHFGKPDPIEAIKIRMEDLDLKQKDLAPYIGSPSKVSEVLSGNRSLSLQMIRALSKGLGIPTDVLVQEDQKEARETPGFDWEKFPLKEMSKRNWFVGSVKEIRDNPKECVQRFFGPLEGMSPSLVLWKRSIHERAKRNMDEYALRAWVARILIRAQKEGPEKEYKQETVNKKFMEEIVRLSWSKKGPLLAQEYLANHGIALVIEAHLPKTHLDGASLLAVDKRPVIGLTIRHDRLDNFWFALMHELAHVCLHLKNSDEIFIDDLDVEMKNDAVEMEADKLAEEVLVPRKEWVGCRAKLQKTPEAIIGFAEKLGVHPAIVAGKIRHEAQNYKILRNMVGRGQVGNLFSGDNQL